MAAPPTRKGVADASISSWVIAYAAVLFIGLSKAGFGGGLGMLTTPLCVMAFGPKDAVGILLPLLCAGDAFTLYHYWGKWEKRNVMFLLPGVLIGVLVGVQLIGHFSARQFNIVIGILAIVFVIFQLTKERIFAAESAFKPNHRIALPFGLGIGITSTFAHGAGPVAALYLVPQKLAKEVFVATNILIFTCVNWIKMPFFVLDRTMIDVPVLAANALINQETLLKSLILLPILPIGVWVGVWLNRKVSEKVFMRLVYLFTFLTGLHLIFNFNFSALLGR
ncbi:MAG: sulfite exporter TauE/SafE family protein [Verrucomicrobiota bacterium]